MTAFDYTRAEDAAARLISRFGRVAYLRKAGSASGDAWNPTTGSNRDWQITVVDLRHQVASYVNTSVVQRRYSDMLVGTSGLSLVKPEKGDKIVLGTGAEKFPEEMSEFEISEVRPLAPGPVTIMYEIDLVR